MQADTQANQSASAIDRTGHITNFTENRASNSFFSQDSKETCSLIFVSFIKKVYQENIPFVKPVHIIFQQFTLGCENVIMTAFNLAIYTYDNDRCTVIYDMLKMQQGCLKSLEYYVFSCLYYKMISHSKLKTKTLKNHYGNFYVFFLSVFILNSY